MIKVRFFGVLRLNLNKSSIEAEAENVNDLISEICKKLPDADYKELRNSIIFVNDKDIAKLKGYKTRLSTGDEVMFLSPVSGG